MTFNYEGFRNTLPGWFLVAVVAFILVPYSSFKELNTGQTVAVVIVGLLSSHVVGYVITQMTRAWQDWRHTRPNNTEINVADLAEKFRLIADLSPNGALRELARSLAPLGSADSGDHLSEARDKDLHRYLWVTLANKDLRDRSESYWERRNTNLNLMVVLFVGPAIGLALAITHGLNSGFRVEDWGWFAAVNGLKATLLAAIWVALERANREYLRIARGIENAWIRVFLASVAQDPKSVRLY